LKTGVTLESFHSAGTIPLERELLNISVRERAIAEAVLQSIWLEMLRVSY